MKQLISLFLLIFLLSCDKNDPKPISEEHLEQEIFNSVIGTWRPNRLAYDKDFKQIECMMDSPCGQKYHVTFSADSTANVFSECLNEKFQGSFYVKKQVNLKGSTDIKIKYQDLAIYFSPTMGLVGGVTLHNYTDSTLIFSGISHIKDGKSISNFFSEFKRVK